MCGLQALNDEVCVRGGAAAPLAVVATGMRARLDLVIKVSLRAAVPVFAATAASLVSALAFTQVLA